MFRLFAVFVVSVAAVAVPASAEEDRHVLLISIDGFPAYLFDDPRASIPVLRELAASGTVAKGGMQVSNPTITWPNHASMVTGTHPIKHSMVLNAKVHRHGPNELTTLGRDLDKADLIAMPTIYDVVHAAGLSTAVSNWPATRGADTITYNFPGGADRYEQVRPPQLERELAEIGVLDRKHWRGPGTSPTVRDEMYTRAAEHIIRTYKPRFMMVHLLNMDSTHHNYGAQTPASYNAAAYADACVRRVVQALDDAGIRDRTTIIVASDHGFATTHKEVRPNVILRKAGLLAVEGTEPTGGRAHARAGGGRGWVYLLNPATRDADRRQIQQLFEGVEGIAKVIGPDQFTQFGLPDPEQNAQMGDLWIIAEAGYAFSSQVDGDEILVDTEPLGFHGYPADQEKMKAMFLASGPGIRQGAAIEGVQIIDIAPTIAALFGIDMPTADGRVLEAMLSGSARAPAPAE